MSKPTAEKLRALAEDVKAANDIAISLPGAPSGLLTDEERELLIYALDRMASLLELTQECLTENTTDTDPTDD